MAQRIANIDAVKVTGLIALYIGHSTLLTAYPQINGLLDLYLDTAFMFLAGYFCMKSLETREYKFTSFWKNKVKTFLIPFWIIIALWYFAQRMPLRPATFFVAYGLGLRALALPPEWDLFVGTPYLSR
jgi:fucose 4-O-acetylase-like acetyltransferase